MYKIYNVCISTHAVVNQVKNEFEKQQPLIHMLKYSFLLQRHVYFRRYKIDINH